MSIENGIIPFKTDIPHDYDYEGEINPLLPNPATTVLFNAGEKSLLVDPVKLASYESGDLLISNELSLPLQASQSVAEYRRRLGKASSASLKRSSMEQLRIVCGTRYPEGYEAARTLLEEQLGLVEQSAYQFDPASYEFYSDLLAAIEDEFQPPSNVRICLRFKSHIVTSCADYENQRVDLEEEIGSVFVKGQNNIYYRENIAGMGDKGFQEQFRRYNSFRKALVHQSFFFSTQGRIPTEREVEDIQQKIEADIRIGTIKYQKPSVYDFLVYTILDNFIAQGYKIREISEMPKNPYIPEAVGTLTDFKKVMQAVVSGSRQRSADIAAQLTNFVAQTQSQPTQTNVYGLFGTYHSDITENLPFRLQAVTQHRRTQTHTPGKHYMEVVTRKLFEGESISDEEWEKAYRE